MFKNTETDNKDSNKQKKLKKDCAFKCAGIKHATPGIDSSGQRKKENVLVLKIVFK